MNIDQAFLLLKTWLASLDIGKRQLSESDTRSKFIDPLFRDVFGWPEREIIREEPSIDGFVVSEADGWQVVMTPESIDAARILYPPREHAAAATFADFFRQSRRHARSVLCTRHSLSLGGSKPVYVPGTE
ncbi:MAG: hypothetical protein R3B06_03045 [Kofleriaceae bacterium]